MRLISVVTPCYNEEANVREIYAQVKRVFESLDGYTHEHLFIDNASTDHTVAVLKELAAEDPRVKVIVNARNFGQVRSPYHAILQARGDAVVGIVADLQDPPGLIADFIREWEAGAQVVMGIKTGSQESPLVYVLRTTYYGLLQRLSDVELVEHFTGFGLYDRQVVETLRSLNDPYPYVRGLLADLGFTSARIEYQQAQRKKGRSKNNLFTLFDFAMLGMTSYTKVPLRLATFLGFCTAGLSLLVGLFYLLYKLIYWEQFSAGTAPLVVGLFFFSSVQLIFLGIVGEYVGSIHTYVQRRPHVIERERINFDAPIRGLSEEWSGERANVGAVPSGAMPEAVSRDGAQAGLATAGPPRVGIDGR